MKIVFDTNILVRAFMSPRGSANQALNATFANRHTLVLSNDILREVTDVLRRPRVVSRHAKSEEHVHDFGNWLKQVALIVAPDLIAFAPIRDANDTSVMRTAIAGTADIICTLDRDFFESPAAEFLKDVGITVLTDVQLLHRLRQ